MTYIIYRIECHSFLIWLQIVFNNVRLTFLFIKKHIFLFKSQQVQTVGFPVFFSLVSSIFKIVAPSHKTFYSTPFFSKKATKIDEIMYYVASVKSTVKISSIFVAFLENMNFNFSKGIFMQ